MITKNIIQKLYKYLLGIFYQKLECAMESKCKIIPVVDSKNFVMPNFGDLPRSIRTLPSENQVSWTHEYQPACIDKIQKFIQGDVTADIKLHKLLAHKKAWGRSSP